MIDCGAIKTLADIANQLCEEGGLPQKKAQDIVAFDFDTIKQKIIVLFLSMLSSNGCCIGRQYPFARP